eukprot:4215329-Prymnesium_polylepis.2
MLGTAAPPPPAPAERWLRRPAALVSWVVLHLQKHDDQSKQILKLGAVKGGDSLEAPLAAVPAASTTSSCCLEGGVTTAGRSQLIARRPARSPASEKRCHRTRRGKT